MTLVEQQSQLREKRRGRNLSRDGGVGGWEREKVVRKGTPNQRGGGESLLTYLMCLHKSTEQGSWATQPGNVERALG